MKTRYLLVMLNEFLMFSDVYNSFMQGFIILTIFCYIFENDQIWSWLQTQEEPAKYVNSKEMQLETFNNLIIKNLYRLSWFQKLYDERDDIQFDF